MIVAARWPSIRVIETGPGTSSTSAIRPSLTGPRGRFFSSAIVVAGWADLMTTSRSVSSMIALPDGVPRTAPATAAPSVAWLKPASAALALAVTEIRGMLCARSLWTSVTSFSFATSARTCSDAFFSTSASAAFTTTLRSWLPKPSPAAMVVSPMPSSLPSAVSMRSCVASKSPESFRVTWYEAWLAPVPPPKAAMKPEEPTVTW